MKVSPLIIDGQRIDSRKLKYWVLLGQALDRQKKKNKEMGRNESCNFIWNSNNQQDGRWSVDSSAKQSENLYYTDGSNSGTG